MAAKDLGYFPFYPRDFASDGAVEAMCTQSVGAYTLLLCKAWFEKPPGTLPKDDSVLSKWARVSDLEWSRIRGEVLAAFVDRDGRYSQKRMISEHSKLTKRLRALSEGGKKGGRGRTQVGDSQPKAKLKPSSSSAFVFDSDSDSSSSGGKSAERGGPDFPLALAGDDFTALWADYVAFKAEKGKKFKPRGEAAALTRLAGWGKERAIKAIHHSMANNWEGIFEEQSNGSNGTQNGRAGQRSGSTSSERASERRAEQRGREYPEPPAPLPILRLGGA